MIVAAIDLGTVTSRLMIGEVKNGSVEILCRDIIITNLGQGLASTGVISDAAYARLLGALMCFSEAITDLKVHLMCEGREYSKIPIKSVATSAMRDAHNADIVLSELADLGFDIEVISGAREAELSFVGTLSGFAPFAGEVMTLDIGGGSTEVIVGTSKPRITASHSFDIGSRRVTELFLPSCPPSVAMMRNARLWVEEHIASFFDGVSTVPSELIAVAGTATSALTIRDGIKEYDGTLVHGKRLTTEELEELIASLGALNLESLEKVPGLHPHRAPVIVGGLIILAAVLSVTKIDSFLVSDTDILQGIILAESAIC